MIPLTRYQVDQIKFYGIIIAIVLTVTISIANIITYAMADAASIDRSSYVLRKGIPFIQNSCDYIKLIKNYPHNPGVKLTIHTVNYGESLWSLSRFYNVSVDTLLGANPWLKKLILQKGQQIVVPSENGYLFTVDDRFDADSIAEKVNGDKNKIRGQFSTNLFKLFCKDDIRLIFIPRKKPLLVSRNLELLYGYRKKYQTPAKGNYTSLFGMRVDPIFGRTMFHNGLDINGNYGDIIKPFAQGMVIYTGWKEGFGRTILIQHHDGLTTMYAHCSKIFAKKGQWVQKSDKIGKIGSTGRSTGPHLHFSIYKYGKEVDPILYIW
jgi:murein DD-endopeptidase MepM/ murein hydrolase activator NlpD